MERKEKKKKHAHNATVLIELKVVSWLVQPSISGSSLQTTTKITAGELMRIKTKREQQKKRNRRRVFHFILLFSFASDFFFLFTVWINVYNSFIQLAVLKSTTVDAVTIVLYYVPTLLLVLPVLLVLLFASASVVAAVMRKKWKKPNILLWPFKRYPLFGFFFKQTQNSART